jgi:hypothetical protein
MKKLLIALASVVPLAGIVAVVLLLGQSGSKTSPADFESYLQDLREAVARRDLDHVRPLVQVTGRPIVDSSGEMDALIGELGEERPGRRWAAAAHDAFSKLMTGDVPGLRKPCIEGVIRAAKASGQTWRGLRTFLEGTYAAWWEGRRGAGPGAEKASLPCFAEFVSFQGRPAWLVVVNWEIAETAPVPLDHIAIFVVAPDSGDVLAAERCE